MGDDGIVSGYRTDIARQAEPALLSPRNDAAEAWATTQAEALALGIYANDSNPAGTATRPFTAQDHVSGDRDWLAGSLALRPDAQAACLRQVPEHERTGAPRTGSPRAAPTGR